MIISKSQYIRAKQCLKSLWLYKHKKELIKTEDKKFLFETGYNVGDYAKKLFPGGVEIEFNPNNFNKMIKKTKELIKNNTKVIYEATFSKNSVFAMVDILVKKEDGWEMYEVKSSTSLKDYYLDDMAIQWFGVSQEIELKRGFIVYINKEYERNGELEINKLFAIVDVTDEILKRQENIPNELKEIEKVINSKQEPDIQIGKHCFTPFECDFMDYCWKDIPEYSIFDLYKINLEEKIKFLEKGIKSLEDLNEEEELNDFHKIQLKTYKEKSLHIEKEKIKEFLNKIKYPINFLDFETFIEPIPRFERQKPYEQIPFQYSLHILYEDGKLEHKEFLGDENSDPRKNLAKSLLNDLTDNGSIIAYNKNFEIRVIKKLAEFLPEYKNKLLSLTNRFVDLIEPFRNFWLYHYDFKGNFSIKSVLPALFPNDENLNYKNLHNIQNGNDAMNTFAKLHLIKEKEKVEEIKQDLLKYCNLDTYAMVKLYEKLKELI